MSWTRHLIQLGYRQPNLVNKQLILAVLNSTATKREAKDYMKKYGQNDTTNHCLILVRDVWGDGQNRIERFSHVVGRLKLLGVNPIFVLHPRTSPLKIVEKLDYALHKVGLSPMRVSDPLVKMAGGQFRAAFSWQNLKGIVPIVHPIYFDEVTCKRVITNSLSDFMVQLVQNANCHIEKFVILNEHGGIPSGERQQNSHVFINLSQEFDSLKASLQKTLVAVDGQFDPEWQNFGQQIDAVFNRDDLLKTQAQMRDHLEDLQVMNAVLSVLPFTSSGLLTTPQAASALGSKNPILYNVLTDRSLISSSLPRFKKEARSDCSWYELPISDDTETKSVDAALVTTMLKKGVNIKTFDYKSLNSGNCVGFPKKLDQGNVTPVPESEQLDLSKVKRIIDDSFGRELDLCHYLERINGRIASIIVIGDYEGIAILTFEGPQDFPFPYLDKFAVLPHLKGSLGISDIIFNLMFKKFPTELAWRSRKDNVVNKWYFQRSVGVLDLSINVNGHDAKESIFRLFFHRGSNEHGSNSSLSNRIREYAYYVRDIKPSWKS
ncbi:LAMI_0H11650g1_1 [Lachancea mirantina]|uniref:Amino-acid acetyltransferase, mitochondrial n=1 Tax=Lachancea mirantina TaxID=1230905 RepID=A0A1G4KHA3_9SACH|nr:LAMI_0H11650g1_1 [Lachancea mirantina]